MLKLYFIRVFAKVIDLIFPIITSGLGYYLVSSASPELKQMFGPKEFILMFYIFSIFILLFMTRGQTLGEMLLKIKAIVENDPNKSFKRSVIKEIYLSILICSILNSYLTFSIFIILSYFPIGKSKNDGYILNSISLIFGLRYIFK